MGLLTAVLRAGGRLTMGLAATSEVAVGAGALAKTAGAIGSESVLGSTSSLGASSLTNASNSLRWQNGGGSAFLNARSKLGPSNSGGAFDELKELWDNVENVTDTIHDLLTPNKTNTEDEKKDGLEKTTDELEELMKKIAAQTVSGLSKISKSF